MVGKCADLASSGSDDIVSYVGNDLVSADTLPPHRLCCPSPPRGSAAPVRAGVCPHRCALPVHFALQSNPPTAQPQSLHFIVPFLLSV
jgi:hypothetical protein